MVKLTLQYLSHLKLDILVAKELQHTGEKRHADARDQRRTSDSGNWRQGV